MTIKKSIGAKGFKEKYWQENYSDPVSMDCVGNAIEHANYLKSLFQLEFIDISTVCDFGFGMGWLFKEVLKKFIPHTAYGIEPSRHMFDIVKNRVKLKPVESTKLLIEPIDLLTWAKTTAKKQKVFDLGICTSVFQYLTDEELEKVLPVMAKKVRYLYFTAPTNIELNRQIEELNFKDEYALRRSRTSYHKLLRKHFTFVSGRLLESKVHFDETNTLFSELIFRY